MRFIEILRQRTHASVLLAALALINAGLWLPEPAPERVEIPLALHEVTAEFGSAGGTPAASLAAELETLYELAPDRAADFSEWILAASDLTGVPPQLLASVIRIESHFELNARSRRGAVGPGQVRPKFWSKPCSDIGPLTDPAANISCAARILAQYNADHCDGDWHCALANYNVGPRAYQTSRVMRAAGQRYVAKVTALLEQHGNDLM